MLKIIENIDNNELISPELSQKLASLIVDKNYDYSIEENYYIPDINSHTINIMKPMKVNTFLNKNTSSSLLETDRKCPVSLKFVRPWQLHFFVGEWLFLRKNNHQKLVLIMTLSQN